MQGAVDREREGLSGDTGIARAIYEAMVQLRMLDEAMGALVAAKRVPFHASTRGEEAAIVGSLSALRDQDVVFPSNRDFAAALLRKNPIASYVHQTFGSALDAAKGRQMPDHGTGRAARVASVSAATGAQITHAVGYAWGAKKRKDGLVVLATFGEGATSTGDFHNGANFAGVFQVPCILFCRNNGRATTVPASRQTASAGFAAKAIAYGMPGTTCDGSDALAVHAAVHEALLRAASGGGPTLVEAVVDFAAPCPIATLRRHLESRGQWSEGAENELRSRFQTEIAAATAAAMVAPGPDRTSMFDDVYASAPWHLADQAARLAELPLPTFRANPEVDDVEVPSTVRHPGTADPRGES